MAREMYDPVTKKWYPPEEYYDLKAARHAASKRSFAVPTPQVMKDIEPYQSMITGERITSRSHHRAHLRDHECVEIGTEKPIKRAPPKRSAKEKADSVAQIKAVAREKGIDVV